MKKSPLTRKLGALALAVILLLSSLLVSCGESGNPLTFEEMQDKVMVLQQHGIIESPYLNNPEAAKVTDFIQLKTKEVETITYRGVEYTPVREYSAHFGTEFSATSNPIHEIRVGSFTYFTHKETVSFFGVSSDGTSIQVMYNDEWKLPLAYKCFTQAIYGEEVENPNLYDIIEISEDFVEDYINKIADFKIDLSKYEVKEFLSQRSFNVNETVIVFERYVNGISVHSICIHFTKNGQVFGYSMQSEPLSEDVYKLIPKLTEEEWAKLSLPAVERAFKYANLDVTVKSAQTIYDLGSYVTEPYVDNTADFSVRYNPNSNQYCVFYKTNITVEDDIQSSNFLCLYPIYTLPEE